MKKLFLTLLLLIGFTMFNSVNASTLVESEPNSVERVEITKEYQQVEGDVYLVVVTTVTEYGVYDEDGNEIGTIVVVTQTVYLVEVE